MAITICVTYPNLKEAKKISNYLFTKRLVACVKFLPVKSQFWWRGHIQKTNEVMALLTTKKQNWTKVRDEIKKRHSYEVPCVEKISFEANKEYEGWIKEVVK